MVRYITKKVAEHHRWMREQRRIDKKRDKNSCSKIFNTYLLHVPGYGSISYMLNIYYNEKVYESIA